MVEIWQTGGLSVGNQKKNARNSPQQLYDLNSPGSRRAGHVYGHGDVAPLAGRDGWGGPRERVEDPHVVRDDEGVVELRVGDGEEGGAGGGRAERNGFARKRVGSRRAPRETEWNKGRTT